MTEQTKHPNYEFIVAFAEGKQLQWYDPVSAVWVNFDAGNHLGPWYTKKTVWRVKPESRWYRVALFKNALGEFWAGTADRESDEVLTQNSEQFVRWITDRVEYEP